MTMARLNISHGTMKSNLKLLYLYAEAKRLRPHKTCAVMIDIKGREIRVSPYKEGCDTCTFEADDVCTLRTDDFAQPSNNDVLQVDCFYLSKVCRPTDMIFLNDGKLRAEVIDVEEDAVKIRFKEGGDLPSGI